MRLRLKSPAPRFFTQSFIQALIKETIKAPRHWPFLEEFTDDRWIPRTEGQLRWKKFPFHDVIMLSILFRSFYALDPNIFTYYSIITVEAGVKNVAILNSFITDIQK